MIFHPRQPFLTASAVTFFLLTSYRIFLMLQEQLPQGNLRSWNKRQMRPLLGPMLTQFMQDGALYFAMFVSFSVPSVKSDALARRIFRTSPLAISC